MMQQLALRENIENWSQGVTVDLKQQMVLNVALAGPESKNGYRYTESALSEAVALYNDRPVFLDHSVNVNKPAERSARDLAGTIVNPRFQGGKIRGDIRLLETESGQTFLKLVESGCPNVGMSHVVLAQKSSDGTQVNSISDVISVDVVINPATTTSFSESVVGLGSFDHGKLDHGLSATQSYEELVQERNDLKEQALNFQERLNSLQSQLDVRQMIDQSALPASVVTPHFREQLVAAASHEQRKLLIQDRLSLLREIQNQSHVVSQQRRHPIQSTLDRRREEFLRVLLRKSPNSCEG